MLARPADQQAPAVALRGAPPARARPAGPTDTRRSPSSGRRPPPPAGRPPPPRPPFRPAPGPMSTTWSAAASISRSCSMTSTVLPRSRSRRQHLDQPGRVAGVEADRRLVQNVQHPGQPRAKQRGQPQPLRLPGRQAWARRAPASDSPPPRPAGGATRPARSATIGSAIAHSSAGTTLRQIAKPGAPARANGRRDISTIVCPATVTCRLSGRSRVPSQSGQACWNITRSILSR